MKNLQIGIYKITRALVKAFYPKIEVKGLENLPAEPCILVGNHCQMNGPITGELYAPRKTYIWCAGEMMHLKEVPAYAFQDFWARKPRSVRWFFRLLSYVIAPLSVCVFNNAHTIGVYHDQRIIKTFKETASRLQEGADVMIFPEQDVPRDHILCEFQDGFVAAAKNYYRQTGREVSFVPVYLAPSLRQMHLGEPVRFRSDAPIKEERRRICQELMNAITHMACSLPAHKVVPYNNIPKKAYGTNLPPEVPSHEKTCC